MKMVIIGAGATRGSEHANPDRKPPLSNDDLVRMFKEPAYHIPTIDMSYYLFLSRALELYDNDMEALFTGIYILANKDLANLKDEKTHDLENLASHIIDIKDKKFSNMLTIFQGKLLMEMQLCIGTKGKMPAPIASMPICSWHRKLASQLNSGDVVVSFNYDLIMPYALLNEKKLSPASFLNPYIKEVDIPKEFLSNNPVALITPHGSFAWQIREKQNYYDNKGKFHPSEHFFTIMSSINQDDLKHMSTKEIADLNIRINPPFLRVNLNNNPAVNYSFDNVILPLKKKKLLLNKMPHLKEEYDKFLSKLAQADEVYLVGKNFISSDIDIAEDVRNVCSESPQKHVIYINPDSTDPQQKQGWVEYHNSILNAASHECYKDLFQYIAEKNL